MAAFTFLKVARSDGDGEEALPHAGMEEMANPATNNGSRPTAAVSHQLLNQRGQMEPSIRKVTLATLMGALLLLTLVACGGDDPGPGMTEAQIREIAREEAASAAQPAPAGTDKAEIEAMISAAMAQDKDPEIRQGTDKAEIEAMISAAMTDDRDEPAPETGMSKDEVTEMIQDAAKNQTQMTADQAEDIARSVIASIPAKTSAAEYTKFVVDNAISRYQTHGLNSTISHYNEPNNVDGQWYVFIIDGDAKVISHYNPDRLGLNLNDWAGTDVNGYNFGPDMLAATEDGRWVSYVYRNPTAGTTPTSKHLGDQELKNAWVVSHDGLIFGSGWYVNADRFGEALVAEAIQVFRSRGLEGTSTHFRSGASSLAGLENTISYWNNAPDVDGNWYAFIADRDGTLISHFNPAMVGKNLTDMFGPEGAGATKEGGWVTRHDEDGSLTLRAYVVDDAGLTFGTGWFGDN